MPDTDQAIPTDELISALGWDADASDADEPDSAETPVAVPTPQAAPVPTPIPVAAPAPGVPDAGEAMRTMRVQQARAVIGNAAMEYKRQLLQGGWNEEAAQARAEDAAAKEWANFQRDEALNVADAIKKQELVQALAKEHGIPAALLEPFPSPDSMRAAAKAYGDMERARVAAPKAPVQQFDRGTGASGDTRRSQQMNYILGKGGPMTAKEYRAVFGRDPL